MSAFYFCSCLFPFLFFLLFCFVIFCFSMRHCFKLHRAKQIPQHSSIVLWILSLEACFKMLCAPDSLLSSHPHIKKQDVHRGVTRCNIRSHVCFPLAMCVALCFVLFFLKTGFGSILVTSQCCDTEQWPKKFPPSQRL